MAPDPPDTPVPSLSLPITERTFFLPGGTTLARSDEETCPLDEQEIRILMQETNTTVYKDLTSLPPSEWRSRLIEDVFPRAKEIIGRYWKEHRVWTHSIDLIEISGWNGSKEGARKWFQVSARKDYGDHHKQMATEIGDVFKKSGYPNVSCIVLLVKAWP